MTKNTISLGCMAAGLVCIIAAGLLKDVPGAVVPAIVGCVLLGMARGLLR